MQPDQKLVEAIQKFASLAANRYCLVEVWLFGSRARGTHVEESDVDVAVILQGARRDQRFLDVKLDMSDLAFDVLLESGLNISPFPIWEDEWANSGSHTNPSLLHNIKNEGVLIVGSVLGEKRESDN